MEWSVLYRQNIPFLELEDLQKALIAEVSHPLCDKGFLLVSEPNPTFTCGRSGSSADLLVGEEALKTRGYGIVPVSRGGKWTYHGPGQILLYPIVKMSSLGYSGKEVRVFLNTFRAALAGALQAWGVEVESLESPFGIYGNGKKLVSFGLDMRAGVVSHGASVYLRDQTQDFQWIHPCGVPGQAIGALSAYGIQDPWERVASKLAEAVKMGLKTPEKPLV